MEFQKEDYGLLETIYQCRPQNLTQFEIIDEIIFKQINELKRKQEDEIKACQLIGDASLNNSYIDPQEIQKTDHSHEININESQNNNEQQNSSLENMSMLHNALR